MLTEDTNAAGRRILVTFDDRSINRLPAANPLATYQSRGSYDNSHWSTQVASELAARHGLRLLAQWPVTELGVSCVVYEIPEDHPVDATMASLTRDRQVKLVQFLNDFRALHNPQESGSGYNDPYLKMQGSLSPSLVAKAHRVTTGKGIRIAIVDTGVDVHHPDLEGHIQTALNLAPLDKGADTADVHGTAVAGIVSAQPNNGIGIVGLAPGAQLISLRACWPEASGRLAARCNSYTLALALNEAIRLRADIINFSLAGPDDSLVQALLEAALKKGIIIVAAVPEDDQPGRFPADLKGVFAVASAAAQGRQPQSTEESLTAPGHDVLTTVPRGAYNFMTGSSFAAPHVASVIALAKELQPDMDPSQLRALLVHHSFDSTLDAVSALAQH